VQKGRAAANDRTTHDYPRVAEIVESFLVCNVLVILTKSSKKKKKKNDRTGSVTQYNLSCFSTTSFLRYSFPMDSGSEKHHHSTTLNYFTEITNF
jgi:hypothetical protein